MMRHPSLSERTPQALTQQRAGITLQMVQNWFHGLETFLKSEVPDWADMMGNPTRVFNADETGFPLSAKFGCVLAPKGIKHVYQRTGDKTQLTVIACTNASGQFMPPMTVYPLKRLVNVGQADFTEAIYARSDNGWMNSEVFLLFLQQFVSVSVRKEHHQTSHSLRRWQ